jgi:hypothetical protein
VEAETRQAIANEVRPTSCRARPGRGGGGGGGGEFLTRLPSDDLLDFKGEAPSRSRMEWGYSRRTSGSHFAKISQCAVRLTCRNEECVAWLETRF